MITLAWILSDSRDLVADGIRDAANLRSCWSVGHQTKLTNQTEQHKRESSAPPLREVRVKWCRLWAFTLRRRLYANPLP